MGTVDFITASAGSGKTWRVVEALSAALARGEARPEGIVATTFTVRAAAELRQRLRARLVADGKDDAARRIEGAHIGTVHALALGWVREFAFDLGLSPNVRVGDRDELAALRAEAYERALGDPERELFEELSTRMRDFDPERAVGEVIEAARSNGVGAESFAACATASVESLVSLLPAETLDPGALERALAARVTQALTGLSASSPSTARAREVLHSASRALARSEAIPWADWWRFGELDAGRESESLLAPVRALATKHRAHPKFRDDLTRSITAVFALAARALPAWDEARRRAGVLDFVDLETLLLGLLARDDLAGELAATLDLVVVDEFQDTSPLQLAIFTRLAGLAPRSLWVGDRKQSIYGFRGADPSLLDRAVAAALGGRAPEVLGKSYRSRGPLVTLTSALFSRAFEGHGMSPAEVALAPTTFDAPALGPVVERWRLHASNLGDDALAIARGVVKLLDDPAARVRDRATGEVRALTPADVAVLCRSNAGCEAVAEALGRAGVPCAVARRGLLSRLEVQLVLAALRLGCAPGDRVARATLVRLTADDPTEDGWLRTLLTDGGEEVFADHPVVCAALARGAESTARSFGLVARLDGVMDALDLPGSAARWGDLAQRRANLDALRALGVRWSARRAESSRPSGVRAWLAWLASLASRGDDLQGVRDDGAVQCLTWHASKGLEWPVVVLAELHVNHAATTAGVHASGGETFAWDDPLAGRALRYWPSPYDEHTGAAFDLGLGENEVARRVREDERREALRLLYVAWTRARDRVVLAARADRLTRGILARLEHRGAPLVTEPMGSHATWGRERVEVVTRECPAKPTTWAHAPEAEMSGARAPTVERAPAFRRPSDDVRTGALRRVYRLGPALALGGPFRARALGAGLHAVFAGDDLAAPRAEREAVARELLESHGVGAAVEPDAVVRSHDRLHAWVKREAPDGVSFAEWPVWKPCADGAWLRGVADRVVYTEGSREDAGGGVLVIDHKLHPGSEAAALAAVPAHYGQLAAYADAFGPRPARVFVHLPLHGLLVELGPEGCARLPDEVLEPSEAPPTMNEPATTDFHARYWASALRLERPRHEVSGLARSIGDARVDLNPHQIDAALFALRSPWSKGVLLADEVGLGKTIEAGLVIAQKWAERRRRVLLIAPATLRKQWQSELESRFFIPSLILETKTFNDLKKGGLASPFRAREESPAVVIASYEFVYARRDDVTAVDWDLVVIDEAHRLRSIYKKTRKARGIVDAIGKRHKVLLTATPLQNSLMELYGLVSILDPDLFGSDQAFYDQYVANDDPDERNALLKDRIKHVCTRTLRRQVTEYIRFTRRYPYTVEFVPSADEQALYEKVSEYLQREVLVALPNKQRKLITLILRKLLASSSAAIGATLQKFVDRLKRAKEDGAAAAAEIEALATDYEAAPEVEEEWGDDEDEPSATAVSSAKAPGATVDHEINDLAGYVAMAAKIGEDAKARALVNALGEAFRQAEEKGARRKAVIFTESVKTQEYLVKLLTESGYGGAIAVMNGTNTDDVSKGIYNEWKRRHGARWKEVSSGSKTADMKAAIVEEFRDRRTLLVATESAAEGVNLQFCSIVINYDLPWNPQRIEQRIGRCHRYGQACDVLVVNFLNQKNEADQRVFEILSQKFKLFEGVFGTSDEVLGTVEAGVDVEKAIAEIYQQCRTADEIKTRFRELQSELDQKIQARMADTRKVVLDNFDEEVHQKLKVHRDEAQAALGEQQRMLLELCRHELRGSARFEDGAPAFTLPEGHEYAGAWDLRWDVAEKRGAEFLRLGHPLAQELVARALSRPVWEAAVTFAWAPHVAALGAHRGKRGVLEVRLLTSETAGRVEQWLLIGAVTSDGARIEGDVAARFFSLTAVKVEPLQGATFDTTAPAALKDAMEAQKHDRLGAMMSRNERYFEEEMEKLDLRAEDLKQGLEKEIKRLDKDITQAQKDARKLKGLGEKLEAQKKQRALEEKRTEKRRRLYEEQDEIAAQKKKQLDEIEATLREQKVTDERVLALVWALE